MKNNVKKTEVMSNTTNTDVGEILQNEKEDENTMAVQKMQMKNGDETMK